MRGNHSGAYQRARHGPTRAGNIRANDCARARAYSVRSDILHEMRLRLDAAFAVGARTLSLRACHLRIEVVSRSVRQQHEFGTQAQCGRRTKMASLSDTDHAALQL